MNAYVPVDALKSGLAQLLSVESNKNPSWASVSFGIFICIDCSALHRSLGVHVSFVRSATLDDHWTYQQFRLMQAGGNAKAKHFFDQHGLTSTFMGGGSCGSCTSTSDFHTKYDNAQGRLYKSRLLKAAEALHERLGTQCLIANEEAMEEEKISFPEPTRTIQKATSKIRSSGLGGIKLSKTSEAMFEKIDKEVSMFPAAAVSASIGSKKTGVPPLTETSTTTLIRSSNPTISFIKQECSGTAAVNKKVESKHSRQQYKNAANHAFYDHMIGEKSADTFNDCVTRTDDEFDANDQVIIIKEEPNWRKFHDLSDKQCFGYPEDDEHGRQNQRNFSADLNSLKDKDSISSSDLFGSHNQQQPAKTLTEKLYSLNIGDNFDLQLFKSDIFEQASKIGSRLSSVASSVITNLQQHQQEQQSGTGSDRQTK